MYFFLEMRNLLEDKQASNRNAKNLSNAVHCKAIADVIKGNFGSIKEQFIHLRKKKRNLKK